MEPGPLKLPLAWQPEMLHLLCITGFTSAVKALLVIVLQSGVFPPLPLPPSLLQEVEMKMIKIAVIIIAKALVIIAVLFKVQFVIT